MKGNETKKLEVGEKIRNPEIVVIRFRPDTIKILNLLPALQNRCMFISL